SILNKEMSAVLRSKRSTDETKEREVARLRSEINSIQSSRSWQLTAPLRMIGSRLKGGRDRLRRLGLLGDSPPESTSFHNKNSKVMQRLSELEAKSRYVGIEIDRYRSLLLDLSYLRLDEDIRKTLIAGYRFCARHGLSLDADSELPDFDSAIAEVAA